VATVVTDDLDQHGSCRLFLVFQECILPRFSDGDVFGLSYFELTLLEEIDEPLSSFPAFAACGLSAESGIVVQRTLLDFLQNLLH